MPLRPQAATSAALLCLVTAASAQSPVQAVKVLGPTKDAGVYHVVTGTWSRGPGGTASLGPDIIYRNDHDSGYFGTGWEGSQGVDEGVVPGTNSPFLGPQDNYLINGLSFSYCATGLGPGISWELVLYDAYVACDDPASPINCMNLVWTMSTGSLPGNSACWLVTFDLTGGAEACVDADGGPCAPGYQGGGLGLDGYGFGQTWLNGGNTAGPILSGNPSWAPRGEGTCFRPGMTCAAGATGLGEQDLFAISAPLSGCFWFGGYQNSSGCALPSQTPSGSMNHTLFADCTQSCSSCLCCDSVSCDESQDPNNVADISVDDGCTGSDGSLIVSMTSAMPDRFAYLLMSAGSAALQDPPGALGTLCVTGQIARYALDIKKTDGVGATSIDLMNAVTGGGGGNVPVIGGNVVGGTWNAQWWYRFDSSASGSRFSSLVTFGPVQ